MKMLNAFIGALFLLAFALQSRIAADNLNVTDDSDPAEPGFTSSGWIGSDSDSDGVYDEEDNCPAVANADQADTDGDGVGDDCDGCPNNPLQTSPGLCGCAVADTDTDADGAPDCTDADDDGDGQSDAEEFACGSDPLDALSVSPDNDSDRVPDCLDADDDNDQVPDERDNCPKTANPTQADLDQDGIGDACDSRVNIAGAVDTMTDFIGSLSIPESFKNALSLKLTQAKQRYCQGEVSLALSQLNAFISQVTGLSGNQLSVANADYLMAQAKAIISAINSNTVECPP